MAKYVINFLMPFAGIFISWLYQFAGKNVVESNNLIIARIYQPKVGVPGAMTALISITTVLTHLFR